MNLIDYIRILVRRGWIIVLLAVIAAGSAYFLSARQAPIYKSTQKVLILPSRADLSLTESTKGIMNSYVQYLDSEYVAQEVINKLQLDMTAAALKGNARFKADTLRLFIQIDVYSTNGDLANDIARTWGEELVRFRQEENQKVTRQDQIDARLQDVARYSLDRPHPLVNAAAGAVLGLLLGGVIVFVLEYLESSVVRRREDLERALDMPVLAAIPDVD
jgi:capsular polysaccharide biosynthesis protein